MEVETHTHRDVTFRLAILTPQDARDKYPGRVLPTSPTTNVYAIAECDTNKGPFVCIMGLDGRVAIMERDLAKQLVTVAYDELARQWAEEGYDRA